MWWQAIIASAILAVAGLFGSRAFRVQNCLLLSIWVVAAGLAGWWQLRIGILSQKSLETSKLSQAEREVYGNLEAAHHLAGFGPGERISLYVPHGRKPEVLVQMAPYVPTNEYGPFRRGTSLSVVPDWGLTAGGPVGVPELGWHIIPVQPLSRQTASHTLCTYHSTTLATFEKQPFSPGVRVVDVTDESRAAATGVLRTPAIFPYESYCG